MIFPLDADGVLYCLQDEQGNNIGTGSREVCQALLHMISHSPLMLNVSSGPVRPSREVGYDERNTAQAAHAGPARTNQLAPTRTRGGVAIA